MACGEPPRGRHRAAGDIRVPAYTRCCCSAGG